MRKIITRMTTTWIMHSTGIMIYLYLCVEATVLVSRWLLSQKYMQIFLEISKIF